MHTALVRLLFCAGLVWLGTGVTARAALVFVRNNPNSVSIVDQHPLARGEALYDTQPQATGRYNRQIDVDVIDPKRRFDALRDYYKDTNAASLRTSLINGGWYCTPTAALSLIKYWDADPRFPNLFDPDKGDTDRSVILEVARLMDTDDVIDRGGADNNENHNGTLSEDILPGLLAYFNNRYPNMFKGGQRIIQNDLDTDEYPAFGGAYDTSIRRNIPVLLEFRGHTTVGIGFNDEIAAEGATHYRVNDPWDARRNISGGDVGKGRPIQARGVFGDEPSFAELNYGPGFDTYDDNPNAGRPVQMEWVEPFDDSGGFLLDDEVAAVPEPGTLALLLVGAIGGVIGRGVLASPPRERRTSLMRERRTAPGSKA